MKVFPALNQRHLGDFTVHVILGLDPLIDARLDVVHVSQLGLRPPLEGGVRPTDSLEKLMDYLVLD